MLCKSRSISSQDTYLPTYFVSFSSKPGICVQYAGVATSIYSASLSRPFHSAARCGSRAKWRLPQSSATPGQQREAKQGFPCGSTRRWRPRAATPKNLDMSQAKCIQYFVSTAQSCRTELEASSTCSVADSAWSAIADSDDQAPLDVWWHDHRPQLQYHANEFI